MPSNFVELMENPTFRIIAYLLEELHYPYIKGAVAFDMVPSTDELRLFWAGIINRAIHGPNENMKELHFNCPLKDRPECGRSCYDAEVVLKRAATPGLYSYLPDSIKFGVGKSKKLTAEINRLVGFKSVASLGQLPQRIEEAIQKSSKRYGETYDKLIGTYKVAMGQVVNDLVKRRNKRIKNKNVLAPIHLVKLSDRVEVLTNDDREYLKTKEGPWQSLTALSTEFKDGIPLDKITYVRDEYKKHYDSTFTMTDKLNTWLSIRRELINASMPKSKKNSVYSKKQSQNVIDFAISRMLEKKEKDIHFFDGLSPYHLRFAFGELKENEWTKHTRATLFKVPYGLLLKFEKTLENDVFLLLKMWIEDLNNSDLLNTLLSLDPPLSEET
jgi:hypothetical protein